MKIFRSPGSGKYMFCCPSCYNVDWNEITLKVMEAKLYEEYGYASALNIDADGYPEQWDTFEYYDSEWVETQEEHCDHMFCEWCGHEFTKANILMSDGSEDMEHFPDYDMFERYEVACETHVRTAGNWEARAIRNDREVIRDPSNHKHYEDYHLGDENRTPLTERSRVRGIYMTRNVIRLVEKLGEIGYGNCGEDQWHGIEPLPDRWVDHSAGWSMRRWDLYHHNVDITGNRINPEEIDYKPGWKCVQFKKDDQKFVVIQVSDQRDDDKVLVFETPRKISNISDTEAEMITYFPTTLDDLERVLRFVMDIPRVEREELSYV